MLLCYSKSSFGFYYNNCKN